MIIGFSPTFAVSTCDTSCWMETNDISEQARAKARELRESGREAVEQARQTGHELKDRAQAWTNEAAASTRELGRKAESYVRENPWPAAVIVGLFAFSLGYLMGSRE